MIADVVVNCHSSIRIKKNRIIYIDPFKINENCNDADFIFITHSHYDHFSIEDIIKIAKKETIYITVKETKFKLELIGVPEDQIIIVEPNKKYELHEISFETVPAYNIGKNFHPKTNNWVGYIIELDKTKYYIAGDTDHLKELESIKCDIAFLPIGGTSKYDRCKNHCTNTLWRNSRNKKRLRTVYKIN